MIPTKIMQNCFILGKIIFNKFENSGNLKYLENDVLEKNSIGKKSIGAWDLFSTRKYVLRPSPGNCSNVSAPQFQFYQKEVF